jgi:uncharacterized protein involved in exopolysaccharide biosynthesis
METPQARESKGGLDESFATEASDQARDAWWSTIRRLLEKRRLIIGMTVGAAVVSIVISLLLPKWYAGTARVLLPTPTGGGALSALLGNLDPAAASILGTSGGDYVRYMAILTSESMSQRVIDRFNLMDEYETRDARYPRMKTLEMLEGNVEFEVDREFDFLAITVLDKGPEQAAEMANFYVEELNRMNASLVSENAANYRHFVEQRYDATIAGLDSAMKALSAYQQESGVIELEKQAEAFLTVLAEYRAASFQAEVEYQALVMDFGKDNPATKAAYNRVQAARDLEKDLLAGEDPLMPVALEDIPEVGVGYAQALREVMIYEKIIEFARPLLEQAIFEEQKQTPAVQVLDQALVPEKKAKPKRMIIVAGATLSVFLLTCLYVLMLGWLERNRGYLASQLRPTGRRES